MMSASAKPALSWIKENFSLPWSNALCNIEVGIARLLSGHRPDTSVWWMFVNIRAWLQGWLLLLRYTNYKKMHHSLVWVLFVFLWTVTACCPPHPPTHTHTNISKETLMYFVHCSIKHNWVPWVWGRKLCSGLTVTKSESHSLVALGGLSSKGKTKPQCEIVCSSYPSEKGAVILLRKIKEYRSPC